MKYLLRFIFFTGLALLMENGIARSVPMLHSSGIKVNLTTGVGIIKDYTLSASLNYTADPEDPKPVHFVNNLVDAVSVKADQAYSKYPAIVIYASLMNPIKGTLEFTFAATFDRGSFTKTYKINLDDSGNITNPIPDGDLPAPQNGIVCEFISVAGIPPEITISCQDLI